MVTKAQLNDRAFASLLEDAAHNATIRKDGAILFPDRITEELQNLPETDLTLLFGYVAGANPSADYRPLHRPPYVVGRNAFIPPDVAPDHAIRQVREKRAARFAQIALGALVVLSIVAIVAGKVAFYGGHR
jgi:hypothetical protein